jgi:hypothetical protein
VANSNDRFWDSKTFGDWTKELNGADVLINLVGKSVDCRYNEANRKEILRSRIESTRLLQEAIDSVSHPPKLWLNASSATIYMHAESILMKEDGGVLGDDFSTSVCKNWETEFFKSATPDTRKVALRTSIVLGNSGGAFPKIKMLGKLGLGGKIGSGRQKFSWIHIEDFCNAVDFIINNDSMEGVLNVTAVNPVTNEDFMKSLRNELKVPFGIPTPKALLEVGMLLFQTESELLLKSRNVYPEKLLANGFKFKFPLIENAFNELCK